MMEDPLRDLPVYLINLPYYRLKAANYIGRLWWLAKRGEVVPRSKRLSGYQRNEV